MAGRHPVPRVLGHCHVCGRKCFGIRVLPMWHSNGIAPKGVIIRDENGIRHGDCSYVRRGTVTPADA